MRRMVKAFLLGVSLLCCGCSDDTVPLSPDATRPADAGIDQPGPDGQRPDSDGAPAGRPLSGFCDPHRQPCQTGLLCLGHLCQRPCDPAKGKQNNPDCPNPAEAWCDATVQGTAVCMRRCDAAAGAETNPSCPVGTTCELSDVLDPGYCAPGAYPPRTGPRQLGQTCAVDYPSTMFCDVAKVLYCSFVDDVSFGLRRSLTCAKACDIKAGTAGNKDCAATEECVLDPHSFLLGRCLPPASKKPGERCDDAAARCTSNLVCLAGICHSSCDPKKGVKGNPDCGPLENGKLCYEDFAGNACLSSCDPTVASPGCSALEYCEGEPPGSDAPGTCIGLPPPQVGPVKVGQRCGYYDEDAYCEAGLACVDERCVPTCDPSSATPDTPCAQGTGCVAATWVSSSGYCAPPATRTLLELCNDSSQRCGEGLVCHGRCLPVLDPAKPRDKQCPAGYQGLKLMDDTGRVWQLCEKGCDPSQGAFADCPVGSTCRDLSVYFPDAKPSCSGKSPDLSGARGNVGDPCSHLSHDTNCDGSKNLHCDDMQASDSHRCVRLCDPRLGTAGNPDCPATESCSQVVGIASFLGGVCLLPASQKAGDACNNYDRRCQYGLTCINNRCHTTCDPGQGKTSNPACPTPGPDFACREWTDSWGSLLGNVCIKICDPHRAVFGNPACPEGTACSSAGYCEPTAEVATGSVQLGQACSPLHPDGNCDGAKKLACVESLTCEIACHPDQTPNTPECASGHLCVGSWLSPAGGYCL